MRILVHDFAGHPFQVQLSRQLAGRGHNVTHVYALGLAGPKGSLRANGAESLTIVGIPLSSHFKKYSPHRRFIGHRGYAQDLKQLIRDLQPDVVLSGNTPIDVQAELLCYCCGKKIGFVHWIQDIYCQALRFFIKSRWPWAAPAATLFEWLERAVASGSDETVAIATDFCDELRRWNIPESKLTVIENWAPLGEMPQLSRDNTWSRSHGLNGGPVLLYSGTLGVKHRPDLLYLLAEQIQRDCTVVVITDGVGTDYLTKRPVLPNLRILPFQPYESLPEVLASADVLLATLEADAGRFAVPSKILTYLCAGRAILFAGPAENLSASIITRSGAGIVADPDRPEAWIDAARRLVVDPKLRSDLGRQGRMYAEAQFDITKITDAFESVLHSAHKHRVAVATLVSAAAA